MVIWTPRARADLKAIHDHIAVDAPQNAKTVVRTLAQKVEPLAELPHLGKVVPEVNDPALREIHAYSWRIIYHLDQGQVYIVTLVHKRQNVPADTLR